MSTASKIRAIMNLVALIVGIIMIVLHIVAIAKIGALGDSITELENLTYQIRLHL